LTSCVMSLASSWPTMSSSVDEHLCCNHFASGAALFIAPATELCNGRTRARETLVAGGDMPLRQGDTLIPGVASAGGPPWPPVYAQHHAQRAPSRLSLCWLVAPLAFYCSIQLVSGIKKAAIRRPELIS